MARVLRRSVWPGLISADAAWWPRVAPTCLPQKLVQERLWSPSRQAGAPSMMSPLTRSDFEDRRKSRPGFGDYEGRGDNYAEKDFTKSVVRISFSFRGRARGESRAQTQNSGPRDHAYRAG